MQNLVPNAFVAECPTRDILSRLAEKWTMLTLAALRTGPMRFGGLRRKIEGVSQKMLTKTLRNLEEDGLVSRTVYDEMPLRVEYELTALGQDCAKRVVEIKLWAEANMTDILTARER
jgi:DNA-binding HxlR family transcriptional regulator